VGANLHTINDPWLRYFHNTSNRDATVLIGFCVAWDVYCTCYAPICHANGMKKALFARIVGAKKSQEIKNVSQYIVTGCNIRI
jgi:phage terminase small subunit